MNNLKWKFVGLKEALGGLSDGLKCQRKYTKCVYNPEEMTLKKYPPKPITTQGGGHQGQGLTPLSCLLV